MVREKYRSLVGGCSPAHARHKSLAGIVMTRGMANFIDFYISLWIIEVAQYRDWASEGGTGREIGWEMRREGILDREMMVHKEDGVSSLRCTLRGEYIFLLNYWQLKIPWEECVCKSQSRLDFLSSNSLDRMSRLSEPQSHHVRPCDTPEKASKQPPILDPFIAQTLEI